MMEWLAQQIGAIVFLVKNPVVVLVALIILWPIYWLQRRIFMKVTLNAAQAQYAGLNQTAAQTTRKHDTGIGTQDALVLKPVSAGFGAMLFPLVFFGGGAAFLGLVVLPDPEERTPELIMAFVISLGFVGLAIWVMLAQLSRIELLKDRIIHRRFLRRTRSFQISEIADVEKLGKAPGAGVILSFRDGRRLRLPASFAGYRDALYALRSAHPKIAGYAFLADTTKRSLAKTK